MPVRVMGLLALHWHAFELDAPCRVSVLFRLPKYRSPQQLLLRNSYPVQFSKCSWHRHDKQVEAQGADCCMERLARWCCGPSPETAGPADRGPPLDELLSECCLAGLQARFLVPSHRFCLGRSLTIQEAESLPAVCSTASTGVHLPLLSCVHMCRDNAAEMRDARASLAHWANARLAAAVSGWRSYIRRHGEMIRRLQATAVKLQQPLQLQAWQSWRQNVLELQAERVCIGHSHLHSTPGNKQFPTMYPAVLPTAPEVLNA